MVALNRRPRVALGAPIRASLLRKGDGNEASRKNGPITGGSRGMELAAAPLFAAEGVARYGRLFLLEMSGDRIHSMNPDGSDRKTIVTGCHLPDGIVVDAEA